MKRAKCILTTTLLLFVICGLEPIFAGDDLNIVVSGNYFSPWDENYKEFYGTDTIFPELKLRGKISDHLFLWVGYSLYTSKATTPILEMDMKSTQHYFSGGAGYMLNISKKLDYVAEVGLFNATYKEEALGEEVKESTIGVRLDNGLVYRLNSVFFIEFSMGFLTASDTVEDFKVKLGGFKSGLGLGIQF